MPLAFGVLAILAATATIPAQTALEKVASAMEGNDFARFSAALAEAPVEVRDAYDDLRAVWEYSLTNPAGAFFDDASSNGLFSRLAAHHSDYRKFIEPYAIHAGARTFYPTAETKDFLAKRRSPPVAVVTATETCSPGIAIHSIVPSARGIVIHASAAIAATRLSSRQPSDDLLSALPILTIDLPNAMLDGVPARAEWPAGPFESMRATRYRTDEGCGIRLRLQPRIPATWRIALLPTSISISPDTTAPLAGAETLGGPSSQPGTVTISSSVTGSRDSRPFAPSNTSGFIAAGFDQSLASGARLRGFISQITPRTDGAPFGAIAVTSMPIGHLVADAAVGDILVNVGDTGDGDLASITSSLFRGAAAGVRVSDAVGVQLFGGRAASATLLRIGTQATYRPTSHDAILGGQVSWIPPDGDYAAAAGALHTAAPGGGPKTLNFFEAGEYRRTSVLRVRLVTEQSHAFDTGENGFAYTLQSRVLTRMFSLDGFLRSLSSRFRPAGGAGFYASLRRSYGLAAALRRKRLSASAAFSQAKVFSILDPENVGSLTTLHDVSVGYVLSRHLSLQASFSESSIHSDPGAKFPADSRTRQSGGGFSLALGKFQGSARLAHSSTENEVDPALDLISRRVDVDVSSAYGRDIYGRFSVAHSERRSGESAGSDYRAAIGAPLFDLRNWRVSAEAGTEVVPAGVAQHAFRQNYATLRVNPPNTRWFSGGFQLTYERVTTNAEKFNVYFASLNTQQLIQWGEGVISPLYETRALRLTESRSRPAPATIHVVVFEDQNQNSKLDPGEPPVTPAFLDIGGRTYRTDAKGEVTAQVSAGRKVARLLPRGSAVGFFVPVVSAEVSVAAGEVETATFALRPAGRVAGRIESEGDIDAALLTGLVVHAVGAVERQAVTSAAAFDLGLLPEGEYVISLVGEMLRDRGLAAVAPAQVSTRVVRGERQTVMLRVRKLTARERFGT